MSKKTKNRRLERQIERRAPFVKRKEDSDEFWRKWHEPRKRQEALQRLYDALSTLTKETP